MPTENMQVTWSAVPSREEIMQQVLLSQVSDGQQCEPQISDRMTQTSVDGEQRTVIYYCDEFEFSGFDFPAQEEP